MKLLTLRSIASAHLIYTRFSVPRRFLPHKWGTLTLNTYKFLLPVMCSGGLVKGKPTHSSLV
jgi:hypothetical protein